MGKNYDCFIAEIRRNYSKVTSLGCELSDTNNDVKDSWSVLKEFTILIPVQLFVKHFKQIFILL